MRLLTAQALADQLLTEIRPYCTRAEVAGSIRREKEEVKDLELAVSPRWTEEPIHETLFGAETCSVNLLFREWAQQAEVQWIKPGCAEVVPWHVKPNGKYWRGYLPHAEVKLDLFLTTPEQWGVIFLIRTGSAEWSHAVAAHAKRINRPIADGWLHDADGNRVETPTELAVFSELGLAWVWPRDRTGPEQVRRLRAEAAPEPARPGEAEQET